MKRIFIFLIILAISLTLLIYSIEQNAYNKSYYISKYKEYNIEKITGKNLQELENITDGLISYLKVGKNNLLNPYFNEREVLHMEDVYNLFNMARIVKYTAIIIIIFIIYYFYKKNDIIFLIKTTIKGLFINHIILLIIGILVYSNFNKYFTYFHLVFFTNDLWLLNPDTDLMIQMLPENFFSGIAINIMISFLTYITTLQIIGYFCIRENRLKFIL